MALEKGKRHRVTRQRKVILEELQSVTSHPTADEIYQMVKDRLPNISLGTVYRNLEVLSETGAIQKIDVDEKRLRYDGNPHKHYHVKCVRCGRVDDLHNVPDFNFEETLDELMKWTITGHRLDFFGVCPECADSDGSSGIKPMTKQ